MKKFLKILAILLSCFILLFFLHHAVRIVQFSEIFGTKEIYRAINNPDHAEVVQTIGYLWATTNSLSHLPKNFPSPAGPEVRLSDSDIYRLQHILLNRTNYNREVRGIAPQTPEIVLSFERGSHRAELVSFDNFRVVHAQIDGMLRGQFSLETQGDALMRILLPLLQVQTNDAGNSTKHSSNRESKPPKGEP